MDEQLRRLERQAATGDLEALRALRSAQRRLHGGTARALKALFATYWTPRGWRAERDTPPEELAHAKQVGVMFDPLLLDHDAQVAWVRRSAAALTPAAVGDAFLASLTSRRLEWRSGLGSYASFLLLPEHAEAGDPCRVCGAGQPREPEDLNVLQFERYKWGGVRHDDPLYAGLDLEQLLLDEPAFLQRTESLPTAEDVALLTAILSAARGLPPRARPAELEKAIAPLLPGNKDERRTLLSILGLARVLRPAAVPPGSGYVAMEEREEGVGDLPWPFALWRGKDGSTTRRWRCGSATPASAEGR